MTPPIKAVESPELCYGLLETEMADPGCKEVTPIIIKRGEKGYYRTDWSWKKEHAKAALDEINKRLGVSPELADQMLGRSMFGWPQEIAP